jgi:hypothetical protein
MQRNYGSSRGHLKHMGELICEAVQDGQTLQIKGTRIEMDDEDVREGAYKDA